MPNGVNNRASGWVDPKMTCPSGLRLGWVGLGRVGVSLATQLSNFKTKHT
jgi:lactate dehydrogenase-like 2-hydroxyacid dehydrogenase